MVFPIRAHLDIGKRLLKGDVYIGRRYRQRALAKSRYCNNCKVPKVGRDAAIGGFRDALLREQTLHASLWTLSGTRLVCHCRANERCHGDVLVEEFRRTYPTAYDRADGLGPPPRRCAWWACWILRCWQANAGWRGLCSERFVRRTVACFAGTLGTCIACLSFDVSVEIHFRHVPTVH